MSFSISTFGTRLFVWLLVGFQAVSAFTAELSPSTEDSTSTQNLAPSHDLTARWIADGALLRILPLGASITYGYLSSDGNGYRKSLRDQLEYAGNKVNMIGSVDHGNMTDNQVEGWPGYVIDQVAEKAELSIYDLPNVVLINVGTNDATQNLSVTNAASRLGKLVDHIIDVVPNVTVVVSTLLPRSDAAAEKNVITINSGYRALVTDRQNAGKKVQLAEMHNGAIQLKDLQDGTHPTDAGYIKMSSVWYGVLQDIDAKKWISPPQAVTGVNDTVA